MVRTAHVAALALLGVAFGCTKILGLDYAYQGTGGQGSTTSTKTSTTTSTTPEGDAGSCGGYVWDPQAGCQACMESSCCADLKACDDGTPCATLAACALACVTGDTTCLAACFQTDSDKNAGSGLSAWDALEACFGTNCDDIDSCSFAVCNSTYFWPTRTCANCLANDAACCAAFTACSTDVVCDACVTNPTAMGCSANMNFQKALACETQTCGVECSYLICDSATIGYTSADCNYCVSKATGGCCSEFDACVADPNSTCAQCISGASTVGCSTDMLYGAYDNCVTTNCTVQCSGF